MKFKDKKNREWRFDIDNNAVEKCKREAGIDLKKVINDRKQKFKKKIDTKALTRLTEDSGLFLDVVFSLLGSQMEEAGVSRMEFCESIDGTINRTEISFTAMKALIDGIVELSPIRDRAGLRRGFKKVWEAI